uniref:Uncharacterized protein n=1 Tax=Oryzias melastigma TaxID=30732 RepID=A0A3B3B7N2_ORYME
MRGLPGSGKSTMARSPVIIDNTNLEAWEMKPYVKMVSYLFQRNKTNKTKKLVHLRNTPSGGGLTNMKPKKYCLKAKY